MQTSPERAEREGPARGRRRREAPLLKGAGWVPPLGRTRGRKGPGRGCERPQGEQPRAGLRCGPPQRRAPASGPGWRQRQAGDLAPGSLSAGGLSPPPRAAGVESESELEARTSRPGGGRPGGRRAGRRGLLSGAPPGPRAAHAAGTPWRLLKSGPRATLFPLFCYIVGAERMSERAADDVRGEPRRAAAAAGGAAAAAARQQQQQPQPPQPQRQPPPPRRLRPEDSGPGAASTSAAVAAMATVGERRPLPSPEAMLGQSWNLWVEASKLPGKDGECARPPPPPCAPFSGRSPPACCAQLPRGSEMLSLGWGERGGRIYSVRA